MKEEIIWTHTRPDVDAIIAVALLCMYKGRKKMKFFFDKEGDRLIAPQLYFKNMRFIDRGRRDLDHHIDYHNQEGVTSTDLVAKELRIDEEKWLQSILRFVRRVDLEGRSLPFDFNDILKSIARDFTVSDEEMMKMGIEMANAIIEFHRRKLERHNEFGLKILEEFFKKRRVEIPERFKKYMKLLKNPRFQRVCDFIEIVVGLKETKNEECAVAFGEMILEFLYKDVERFNRAKKELEERARIIRMGKYIICAIVSDNPKISPAARSLFKADVVVQRNKDGHVQIYFNYQKLKKAKEIAKEIVRFLRILECIEQERKIPKGSLQVERVEEIPEWYFFTPAGGGPLILNGSMTAPNVPVTKIPFPKIIETIKLVLKETSTQV